MCGCSEASLFEEHLWNVSTFSYLIFNINGSHGPHTKFEFRQSRLHVKIYISGIERQKNIRYTIYETARLNRNISTETKQKSIQKAIAFLLVHQMRQICQLYMRPCVKSVFYRCFSPSSSRLPSALSSCHCYGSAYDKMIIMTSLW